MLILKLKDDPEIESKRLVIVGDNWNSTYRKDPEIFQERITYFSIYSPLQLWSQCKKNWSTV